MKKIQSIEVKQDKNKNSMKVCTLQGEGDTVITVYVNSKYDAEIYPLVEVGVDVEIKKEGDFWKIQHESFGLAPKSKTVYPKGGQKTNPEDIKKAQENKQLGIATSSSLGNAVNIALEESKAGGFDAEHFQTRCVYWRKWLLSNWTIPKDDIPPFK